MKFGGLGSYHIIFQSHILDQLSWATYEREGNRGCFKSHLFRSQRTLAARVKRDLVKWPHIRTKFWKECNEPTGRNVSSVLLQTLSRSAAEKWCMWHFTRSVINWQWLSVWQLRESRCTTGSRATTGPQSSRTYLAHRPRRSEQLLFVVIVCAMYSKLFGLTLIVFSNDSVAQIQKEVSVWLQGWLSAEDKRIPEVICLFDS